MSFDLRTGKPVWMMGRPRLAKHKKLRKNIRSDVVVVGGGISGALMAYRLTNLGMQVTLIDSRTIGAGSTTASTAILSYEADVNLGELIEKIGRTPAVRAYRAGIEAIDLIGKMVKSLDDRCDFRRTQSLYLASSRKDVKLLERECAVRQKYKFRVRLLASEELSAKYGLNAQQELDQEIIALTSELARLKRERAPLALTLTFLLTHSAHVAAQLRATHPVFPPPLFGVAR